MWGKYERSNIYTCSGRCPTCSGKNPPSATTIPVENHEKLTHNEMAKKALPSSLYKYFCNGEKEIPFLPVFYKEEVFYQDTRPRREYMPGAVGAVLTYDPGEVREEYGHVSLHYTTLKVEKYRLLSSFFNKLPPKFQIYAPTEEITVEAPAVTIINHFDGRNYITYVNGEVIVEPTDDALKASYDRKAFEDFKKKFSKEIDDSQSAQCEIYNAIFKQTLQSRLFFEQNYEDFYKEPPQSKPIQVSIIRRTLAVAEDAFQDHFLPKKLSAEEHFKQGTQETP